MTIEQALSRFSGDLEMMRTVSSHKTTQMEMYELAIKALEDQKPRGTYECFHCGSKSVVWQSDFDYSDFGYDGEGIVHICQCMNCGADIEYRIPIGEG